MLLLSCNKFSIAEPRKMPSLRAQTIAKLLHKNKTETHMHAHQAYRIMQRTVKLAVFFLFILCAAFVALTIYSLQVSLLRSPSKLQPFEFVCVRFFLQCTHTKTLIMIIIYHE